jgi:hypothetical protein
MVYFTGNKHHPGPQIDQIQIKLKNNHDDWLEIVCGGKKQSMAYLCVSSGKRGNRSVEAEDRGVGKTGYRDGVEVEREDKRAENKAMSMRQQTTGRVFRQSLEETSI